jgi:hypothetical protein
MDEYNKLRNEFYSVMEYSEPFGNEYHDELFNWMIKQIEMRKLIDLDEATFKTLSKLAIDNNTNLKSYIESILVLHAGGGFKDKKPSTKRKLKH